MTKIRVLVVEDSLTVRKRLVEVLNADPALQVVGEAADGRAGIDLCAKLRPDVITLDMMLPVLTGLEATEHIMAHFPTPILIVSASVNRGELFRTYDALAAGAVDVFEKPRGDENDDAWDTAFLATVKLVSRIKVITHLRGRLRAAERAAHIIHPASPDQPPSSRDRSLQLIAIGTSTGGPSAIREILRHLPPSFAVPILLVVHVAEPFGVALGEWLDEQSPIRVRFAVDGEPLPTVGKAQVIMAPADLHLCVRGGRLRLTADPERHSCRPSVDVLFESLADEMPSRAAAFLLTGMGRDGAAGLLQMRRAGSLTVAQDEQSSVVYGMPREAALLGAAERVLSLRDIPGSMVALAERGRLS